SAVSSALVDTLSFLSDDEYAFEFATLGERQEFQSYLEFSDAVAGSVSPDEVILFSDWQFRAWAKDWRIHIAPRCCALPPQRNCAAQRNPKPRANGVPPKIIRQRVPCSGDAVQCEVRHYVRHHVCSERKLGGNHAASYVHYRRRGCLGH